MYELLIIRNGEVSIKGMNRHVFENTLIKNLRYGLHKFKDLKISKGDGRIYIFLNGENHDEVIEYTKNIFGVVSISPAIKIESGYDNLKSGIYELMKTILEKNNKKITFKVTIKRQDKSFPMKSPEMNQDIGGYILNKLSEKVSVDVLNPDVNLVGEMKKNESIIYFEKIQGVGGMPLGSNGKACVLLSGGIDSPVASYLISRRGLYIEAVHFHSFPFTSEKSQEKVMDLANILAKHTGKIRVHMVNLLDIQKEISEKCPEELITILSRRFMMSISEKIALDTECNSLITGESIGQVASQTAEGLLATNNAVEILPVLRPLIAYDKEDIIKLAKKIDTFDTSIIPEEDCCTVFLPKRPATKPRLEKILKAEKSLDLENLIKKAIENKEIRTTG